jgi:hypothetical protein
MLAQWRFVSYIAIRISQHSLWSRRAALHTKATRTNVPGVEYTVRAARASPRVRTTLRILAGLRCACSS